MLPHNCRGDIYPALEKEHRRGGMGGPHDDERLCFQNVAKITTIRLVGIRLTYPPDVNSPMERAAESLSLVAFLWPRGGRWMSKIRPRKSSGVSGWWPT